MSDPNGDSVISVYFSLRIDTVDLGLFATCSGLGIDVQVTQREVGGGGLTTYPLAGRFKYTNLTVTRPIGTDTAKTMSWLLSMVNGVTPSTAELAALDTAGNQVYAWTLTGVIPAKWTGPSFDAGNPQPATESLELAYSSILLGSAS